MRVHAFACLLAVCVTACAQVEPPESSEEAYCVQPSLSSEVLETTCIEACGPNPCPLAADHGRKSRIVVLNLDPVDGAYEIARDFSARLRAIAPASGWTVYQENLSIEQMLIAHECGYASPSCLRRMADTLRSEVLVYGSLARQRGAGYRVTLFRYHRSDDVRVGPSTVTFHENTDSEELGRLAVQALRGL